MAFLDSWDLAFYWIGKLMQWEKCNYQSLSNKFLNRIMNLEIWLILDNLICEIVMYIYQNVEVLRPLNEILTIQIYFCTSLRVSCGTAKENVFFIFFFFYVFLKLVSDFKLSPFWERDQILEWPLSAFWTPFFWGIFELLHIIRI